MGQVMTGSSTIIALLLKILSVYTRLRARDLAEKTSPEMVAALEVLLEIVEALVAADNFPFQIDRIAPDGQED